MQTARSNFDLVRSIGYTAIHYGQVVGWNERKRPCQWTLGQVSVFDEGDGRSRIACGDNISVTLDILHNVQFLRGNRKLLDQFLATPR